MLTKGTVGSCASPACTSVTVWVAVLEFVDGGQIMEWSDAELKYMRKDGSLLSEADCLSVMRDLALGLDYRAYTQALSCLLACVLDSIPHVWLRCIDSRGFHVHVLT